MGGKAVGQLRIKKEQVARNGERRHKQDNTTGAICKQARSRDESAGHLRGLLHQACSLLVAIIWWQHLSSQPQLLNLRHQQHCAAPAESRHNNTWQAPSNQPCTAGSGHPQASFSTHSRLPLVHSELQAEQGSRRQDRSQYRWRQLTAALSSLSCITMPRCFMRKAAT